MRQANSACWWLFVHSCDSVGEGRNNRLGIIESSILNPGWIALIPGHSCYRTTFTRSLTSKRLHRGLVSLDLSRRKETERGLLDLKLLLALSGAATCTN